MKNEKPWCIFVVGRVLDRPNQVRYQRIIALHKCFKVAVVTTCALPRHLQDYVDKVVIVPAGFHTWKNVIKIGKWLHHKGQTFFVHTQYSPKSLAAGYIAKRIFACKWVYDLWDHPSLTWEYLNGKAKWIRKSTWEVFGKRLILKADVWIVAMHPGILNHLPKGKLEPRLIYTSAGWSSYIPELGRTEKGESVIKPPVPIVYVGAVSVQRGLAEIEKWQRIYIGPEAELHIVGKPTDSKTDEILNSMISNSKRNPHCSVHIHGELRAEDAQKIIRRSKIGIFSVEGSVTNYKYAYPIKILEYLHYGLIVVSSETLGVAEFVADGVNGLLYDGRNRDLSDALRQAVDICLDLEIYRSFRETAIRSVKDRQWEVINRRLASELLAMLSSH